jgi:hypothetical protein
MYTDVGQVLVRFHQSFVQLNAGVPQRRGGDHRAPGGGDRLSAPHMFSYANRTRFFSRNSSTGKVQLDMQQIGAAFAEQRGLGERLRSWKTDRLAKAIAGEGPVPMEGSQILFHFVTASALSEVNQNLPRIFDVQRLLSKLRLLYTSPQTWRYNADGILLLSIRTQSNRQSYLQVFHE